MKKIPTLFKRVFYNHSIIDIVPVITEDCEEAFKNGLATVFGYEWPVKKRWMLGEKRDFLDT